MEFLRASKAPQQPSPEASVKPSAVSTSSSSSVASLGGGLSGPIYGLNGPCIASVGSVGSVAIYSTLIISMHQVT